MSPRCLTVGFVGPIQGRGPVVVLEGKDPPDLGDVYRDESPRNAAREPPKPHQLLRLMAARRR